MNAKPGVENTSQNITISVVLMFAPASWSIRKASGFSAARQTKSVAQRNFRI
jgi:hypothetical protein